MSGKSPSTVQTTQNSSTAVAPYVSDAQQALLGYGSSQLGGFLGQTPANAVAGLSTDQLTAFDLSRGMAQNAFTGGGSQAPTQSFDANAYLKANPDVAADSGFATNPLMHYQQYGQTEGRAAPTITAPLSGSQQAVANAMGRSTASSQIAAPSLTNPLSTPGVMAGSTAQGYTPANMSAEQVDGAQIQALQNPYTQSVVDTSLDTMRRQRDQTAASIGAKSAAAGSFGGSRQAVQMGQLDRSFGDQVANTTAGLMSAGYDKAAALAGANAGYRQQAGAANQGAQNTAFQFGAGAQNTRDQFNAGQALSAANAGNANELSRYGADINRYQAENAQANALVSLQEAVKSGDQNRQQQMIQMLLANGMTQQQLMQNIINVPNAALSKYAGIVPNTYPSTTSTVGTQPNTAPSGLQQALGLGGTLLGLGTGGGTTIGGKLLGGLF